MANVVVKDVTKSAAKWVARAGVAATDYENGVRSAGERWQAGAMDAEPAWAAGVQQAAAQKRFGKGIAEAGAAKYVKNATTLGPSRFTAGVQNAEGEWQKGFAPYADVMRNTNLPGRMARGNPSNYMRSQALGTALRQKKVGSQAAA